MNIPILGIIENMSYFECPDCGKKFEVFGKSHINEVSIEYNIPVLAKIPINPELSEAVDRGLIEDYEQDWLRNCTEIFYTS
ncbi:MAG: Mrp/NBP35 family ATP-binding protein, partial [Lachnospiraceae bacterium]|nr:Mrp/NBP35 family ATP-binding protein [Lachnospiraceae bacterium]